MTDSSTPETPANDTQYAASSAPIPPYIAFSTFETFLKEMKDNGIPPQIDKSVLKRFAFGTQAQLRSGLKSLDLVDDGKPTPNLERLVEAFDTPAYADALGVLLRSSYPYVFAIDLMTATPGMFADAFKVTGAKEDVARKCRTFFFHAARIAKVPLGNRIAGSVARAAPGNGPKRKARVAKVKDEPKVPGNEPGKHPEGEQNVAGFMDKLLGKFPEFDPAWNDDLKAKWFANFQDFMKVAKAK